MVAVVSLTCTICSVAMLSCYTSFGVYYAMLAVVCRRPFAKVLLTLILVGSCLCALV